MPRNTSAAAQSFVLATADPQSAGRMTEQSVF
jgi:hypothetical protein